MEEIASIIRECNLREAIYRRRYEPTAGKCKIEDPDIGFHKEYRKGIKALYARILEFQAIYVCYLTHNNAERWVQDVAKWQDWDKLIKSIQGESLKVKALDKHFQGHMQQEEWEFTTQRHDQALKAMDALQREMERFSKLVSDANNNQTRDRWLSQLRTTEPATHYNSAEQKRRKYATGQWLLHSSDFDTWKAKPNSFLWLIGKGVSCFHLTTHSY